MASNGSRKRRRKSKEKLQAVGSTNGIESQSSQQKQKQQKQQDQQQKQQKQPPQQHQIQQQQQQEQPPQQQQKQQQEQPPQQHKKQQQKQQQEQPPQKHQKQQHQKQQQQQPPRGSTEGSQSHEQQLLTSIFERLIPSLPQNMANFETGSDTTEGTACSGLVGAPDHMDRAQATEDHMKSCTTALMSAVFWKHHNMAEMLLQKGAGASDISETGQNSLMLAACNGDLTMLNLLWSYRGPSFDINARNKDGNTALHFCTYSSFQGGVSFLLDRGADPALANNQRKTPMHIAASQGNLDLCEVLLKHLVSTSGGQCSPTPRILHEDVDGRTAICEALKNQHLVVVKMLMEACSPQEALEFYMKNIQKLSCLSINDPTVDLQPILTSLLFVVKRLQNDYLREMAEAETMQHLVHAIRHYITSPRVLSTACLLISVLVWKDSTEEVSASTGLSSQGLGDSEGTDVQDTLIQQFLDCRGPDAVMEKLSTQMFTAHDTYLIVSTLLPVIILASRASGRAWLEQNSSNLSFYKELLTRNKAFITHISLNNHPGLQVGHVIKTFLSFVEETEAKDREQNLAQLLEEEERDRLKRERKKRKRQKKQNKQAKTEVAVATDADLSSDEEAGECSSWSTQVCRSSGIFSSLVDVPVDKDQSNLYYQSNHHRQQQPQASGEDQYTLLQGARHAVSLTSKRFPSEACIVSDREMVKWPQSVPVTEEFPPISTGSEERTCSDSGEGWVKVEGRKQIVKPSSRQSPAHLVISPMKKQDTTRPTPMRWADVAKIGCCRESGPRNVTVLLANVGRYPTSEYYKMSVLSRTSGAQTSIQPEESRNRVDADSEDWQQIARSEFDDNIISKQTDDEHDLAVHSSASSDSESDALSSTLSSECPSGLSDGLQGRKRGWAGVDDFPDAISTKDLMTDKSDHYTYRSAFSRYQDQPREIKSFIFTEADHIEVKGPAFLNEGGKRPKSKNDSNRHDGVDKLAETAWSRAEAKPAMAFSRAWDFTSGTKSLDALDVPIETSSERVLSLHCPESRDDLTLTTFPGSKTPPARACVDTVDNSLTSFQFPSACCGSAYYDTPIASSYLRNSKDTTTKARPYVFPFQKSQDTMKESSNQWCPKKRPTVDYNLDHHSWLTRDTKIVEGSSTSCLGDMINVENTIAASQQHALNCFMPSFASMSSAVENNPMVTSEVESVLTPTVISLSNVTMQSKPPTYSSKATDIPSPPPGFKFQKSNPTRVSNLDHSLAMLSSQATLIKKNTNPTFSSVLASQDVALAASTFSGREDILAYDTRHSDKPLVFGSRTPMSGFVSPFTKSGNEESLLLQHQQHQQQQQQRKYFQTLAGGTFTTPLTGSGILQGPGAESWAKRFRSLALSTASATPSLSQPQFSFNSVKSSFATILSGRLHQRQTLRHQDSQHVQLKRLQQQHQGIQLKSYHETAEICQKRFADQNIPQQQRPLPYFSPTLPQSFRLNSKPAKASMTGLQQKPTLQQHPRQHQQQRLPSPPVLLPSDLRDESDSEDKSSSPVFQDVSGNDLLSDLFADPLLVERIAINQIRQQVLASQSISMMRDSLMSALRDSVYCNDLEYYASLYRLKLKDLLVCSPNSEQANSESSTNNRPSGLMGRSDMDKSSLACSRNHVTADGRCLSPKRDTGSDRFSRRWREALNKIMDTAWTMRHQFGDIVLPNSLSEFNISQVEYPLVLGFTTDGCEVAVLILEKSQAYIEPYLLDIMCDPELDHHFILKCKGMSETCNREYVALDLCDYTLAEYMQIVQLSYRQDPLSANRLAWQLLEGLKFIHHNLSMPHGNLKPSWIFVDSEGRLKLAGYGIVTKHSGPFGNVAPGPDRADNERSLCWTATEDLNNDQAQPSMASDIQVAGMLLYFILTGGQHPFGTTPLESEMTTAHMDLTSDEANDLVSGMLFPDPGARPTVEHCLNHPFFWSSEKKFRLILIVGSDVLTEMKTGIALTGNGSPTMTEILSVLDIADVSLNWVQAINPTVMKEMRSFRVYKNSLSELTLFIYNCCLHFDKMTSVAKEVLDDPCKYFQSLFPSLFMAIYRSLKASDRTDRTCYKPFFC